MTAGVPSIYGSKDSYLQGFGHVIEGLWAVLSLRGNNNLESQWPLICSYFVVVTGYFGSCGFLLLAT